MRRQQLVEARFLPEILRNLHPGPSYGDRRGIVLLGHTCEALNEAAWVAPRGVVQHPILRSVEVEKDVNEALSHLFP